jgi:Cu+-exporting ATPase
VNRPIIGNKSPCSAEFLRNLVLFAGALILIGVVASVGCSKSQTNIGTVQAASNAAVKTITIPVEGMSCAACAARVKKTLKEMPGVQAVELNLEHRNAQVRYVDGQVSPERLVIAINQLGYKAGTSALAGARIARIHIEGMACEAMCTLTVKKALEALDGVTKVVVSLKPGDARVEYVAAKISPEKMVSVINGLGFKAGTPKLEQQ